jgi:hypothetical protein
MAAEESKQGRMYEDTAGIRGIGNAMYEMPAPDIQVNRQNNLQNALKMVGYAAAMVMPAGKVGSGKGAAADFSEKMASMGQQSATGGSQAGQGFRQESQYTRDGGVIPDYSEDTYSFTRDQDIAHYAGSQTSQSTSNQYYNDWSGRWENEDAWGNEYMSDVFD